VALAVAILLAVFLLDAPWNVVVVLVGLAVEAGETYFWMWYSRKRRIQAGPETLIGARGEVTSPCLPEGQVRVVGELWRARCDTGARTGDRVRVVGRDDLVLHVEVE
jgi:membrane-bound serine protease (ClpP class)